MKTDPENNPPVSFVGRLNRTLCFFWLMLNVVWFCSTIWFIWQHFNKTHEIQKSNCVEIISTILIADLCYILIYSLIVTIVYLASGRLLNPLGNKLTTLFTFWGIVVGGVAITLVLLTYLTGVTLYR
jgi:hypothetical protein